MCGIFDSIISPSKGENVHLPIPLDSFVPAGEFWVDRNSTDKSSFWSFSILSPILHTLISFTPSGGVAILTLTPGWPGWRQHWRKAETDCGFLETLPSLQFTSADCYSIPFTARCFSLLLTANPDCHWLLLSAAHCAPLRMTDWLGSVSHQCAIASGLLCAGGETSSFLFVKILFKDISFFIILLKPNHLYIEERENTIWTQS